MRAAAVVMAIVLLVLIHSPPPSHAQYAVIQITDNGRNNMYPRVNDHGFVVWSASDGTDQEIFMYNGQSVVQLTDNALDDGQPELNNAGQVVWEGDDGADDEVFLFDGSGIVQLTDNETPDWDPQISDDGNIVWAGWAGQNSAIFIYDGTTVEQISEDNGYLYDDPKLANNGFVTWVGYGKDEYGQDESCIFLFDGTEAVPLRHHRFDDAPRVNDLGQVAWWEWIPLIGDSVWLYDGGATKRISANVDGYAGSPGINNNGYAAWSESGDPDIEVFVYDGAETRQLHSRVGDDRAAQISGNGWVAWSGKVGSQYEIFVCQGSEVIQLTENDFDDQGLRVSDEGYLVWHGGTWPNYEIYLAVPGAAGWSAASTVPLDSEGGSAALNCLFAWLVPVTSLLIWRLFRSRKVHSSLA
jgi:hypothetical protein